MPSSPASRKPSSVATVAPRLAASARGDLPASSTCTFSFQQSAASSASTVAATRSSYHERSEDHKENSTENGSGRGNEGRPSQNMQGGSKKPWITHFSKSSGTLSPRNRILVDRNSSSSPQRPGGVANKGLGEAMADHKLRISSPRDRDEAPRTPGGTVTGVAELSKRIQQFLEDQDVVFDVKTGSAREVTPSSSAVTAAELGQHTLSSPYNPYRSPFFERPKFLRLTGSATSIEEVGFVSSSVDVADSAMPHTTKELPVVEANQVLAPSGQQVEVSMHIAPHSREDEDKSSLKNSQEQLCKLELTEGPVVALQEVFRPCLENMECSFRKSHERSDCQHLTISSNEPILHSADHIENMALKPADEGKKTIQVKTQSVPGTLANQPETLQRRETADEASHEYQALDFEMQSFTAEGQQTPHGNDIGGGMSYDDLEHTEKEMHAEKEMCWGAIVRSAMVVGLVFAAAVLSVFLSCVNTGLIPSTLFENAVRSWHSSKYYKSSLLVAHGMEGLWSTEDTYIPVDVGVVMARGVEMLHSSAIRKFYVQTRFQLQLFWALASGAVRDWWKVFLQPLSIPNDTLLDLKQEERGRQFEWLTDYEFDGEWFDETPRLQYSHWELLHEYDLGLANQFVFASIPEILKQDFLRNFSRLSESPEVKGLLEDLIKLKGGNTEEDRLEVLQYFWEYTRVISSAHDLRPAQAGDAGGQTGSSSQQKPMLGFSVVDPSAEAYSTDEAACSPEQAAFPNLSAIESRAQLFSEIAFPTSAPVVESSAAASSGTQQQESQQTPNDAGGQTGSSSQQIPLLGLSSEACSSTGCSTESRSLLFSEVDFAPNGPNSPPVLLAKDLMVKRSAASSGTQQQMPDELDVADETCQGHVKDQSDLDEIDVQMEALQQSHTNASTYYVTLWADNIKEEMVELSRMKTQRAVDGTVKVGYVVATLAILAIGRLLTLARSRQSKSATQVSKSISTIVEFLRKNDQQQKSSHSRQAKRQVSMIEELNGKVAALVFQSPEPRSMMPLVSPQTRRDEHPIASPIPALTSPPYGSFTTYEITSRKEGEAVETKLTPVRRSSRIRNNASTLPQCNAVKRIAISPP